ncbi:MAG: ERMES complex subunit [Sclerophora amabilis]|nr:MAG: ERMES complex subunit [Sclerophora amabilis]
MAFNFNWSPLTADSSFYSRAQELLTVALNKSPKPPIIVDDILVNELNLGSVPPELEILEVGDLAEDRFRGIFKMCYTGDAFLTLKTRVQANPLNTYLSTKPSFTSPQPLAASSGLTIPLQITLSDIRLSAFIILVFSRQKGLTLVFRNDPLESLKVSSTFDSIPFVRDYLQKEIEGQLRILLMEEVPAIIHRLSLRLWVPEYRAKEDEELARQAETPSDPEKPIDPLASPRQTAEHPVETVGMSSFSLDPSNSDAQSIFSQKNLLRLAALTDSHRTLSLFTPSLRDTVFRAWAGASEHGERPGWNTPTTPLSPALTRSHSFQGTTSTWSTVSDDAQGTHSSNRPALVSVGSAPTGLGLGLGSGRHSRTHGARKRKTRIINLRSKVSDSDSLSGESVGASSTVGTGTLEHESHSSIPEESDDNVVTPPRSPNSKTRYQPRNDSMENRGSPQTSRSLAPSRRVESSQTVIDGSTQTSPRYPTCSQPSYPAERSTSDRGVFGPELRQSHSYALEKAPFGAPAYQNSTLSKPYTSATNIEPPSSGILERAWMMKMVGELARRVQDEKGANPDFWRSEDQEDSPPPAYAVL